MVHPAALRGCIRLALGDDLLPTRPLVRPSCLVAYMLLGLERSTANTRHPTRIYSFVELLVAE